MAEEPRLDRLNDQVLSNILSRLHRQDLLSLITTCSALRQPAEQILWRNVNLDARKNRWRQVHVPQEDLEDESVNRLRLFESLLLRDGHPKDVIRRLDIFMIDSTVAGNSRVLALLIGQLRILTIWTAFDSSPAVPPSLEHFAGTYELLRSAPALTHLDIHCPSQKLRTDLVHILCSCRKLQHLSLGLEDHSTDREDQELEEKACKELESSPPTITSLDIVLRGWFSGWIWSVIEHAPRLERLRIWADDFPLGWEKVSESIRKHQGLKVLDIRDLVNDNIEELQDIFGEEDVKSLEELIVASECSSVPPFHSDATWIPPLKNLKRLVLRLQDGGVTHEAPTPLSRIPQDRVEEMLKAPRLEMIQVINNLLETSTAVLDPSQWCRKQIAGTLIRTYVRGDDVFIHLRQMVPVGSVHVYTDDDVAHDSEPPVQVPPDVCNCLGDDNCLAHAWTDITDFNGRFVPMDILREVYAIEGKDPAWITPGRDGELSVRGWHYLKAWRGDGPGWENEQELAGDLDAHE